MVQGLRRHTGNTAAQCWSLVKELRSHMPWGTAKREKKEWKDGIKRSFFFVHEGSSQIGKGRRKGCLESFLAMSDGVSSAKVVRLRRVCWKFWWGLQGGHGVLFCYLRTSGPWGILVLVSPPITYKMGIIPISWTYENRIHTGVYTHRAHL